MRLRPTLKNTKSYRGLKSLVAQLSVDSLADWELHSFVNSLLLLHHLYLLLLFLLLLWLRLAAGLHLLFRLGVAAIRLGGRVFLRFLCLRLALLLLLVGLHLFRHLLLDLVFLQEAGRAHPEDAVGVDPDLDLDLLTGAVLSGSDVSDLK